MGYVKASVRSAQLIRAARRVLAREGVLGATLRAVAAEAGVPLGTVTYVFSSKERLLQAVIEDVTDEIADILQDAADTDMGLEHAIRAGLEAFWTRLVVEDRPLQLMQYELVIYALRTPGLEHLARWQFERYCRVAAAWFHEAAGKAGEVSAVPFEALARVLVAAVDGIILQFLSDPDTTRSRRDLALTADMLIGLASVRSLA
ncbi:TetR/AcrR family transcriptional regulator [Streptomyces fractus]|uniref:TetR/AcrR family transcriptional regulator n=1 Tax=Streptomyces fractus TaxID=641806 RepID=UPI003CEEEDE7